MGLLRDPCSVNMLKSLGGTLGELFPRYLQVLFISFWESGAEDSDMYSPDWPWGALFIPHTN